MALHRPMRNRAALDGFKVGKRDGMSVLAQFILDLLDRADTIGFPGWRDDDQLPPVALLDKIRAAQHIAVQADSLYVDVGQIITSAGSAAGLDMPLHLVRRDYGAKVGNLVAQRLVVASHREGGQAQFVPRPIARDEGRRLAKLMDWLRAHPALPHTLISMAQRALMSPRTLQRQFQDATGLGRSTG